MAKQTIRRTGTSKVHPAAEAYLEAHNRTTKLSVGCGDTLPDDCMGIDSRKWKHQYYIQHNLETLPWPIPSDCVEIAIAGLVIEHINPANFGMLKFMDEIHRVVKIDGELMLSTPLAGSPMADTDPTHIRSYTESTFYYFDPMHQSGMYNIYRPRPWKLKGMMFQAHGLLEVVLQKRRWDKSYGEPTY